VDGCSLVHLQCHFGLDTLSWARHGAVVTGLDFSAPAVAEAARLAERIGVEARFVEADVYDAPAALGRTYDVVYTGRGAFNWLPDMGRWAEVVAELLAPAGRCYIVEFHPLTWIFGDDNLDVVYPYFWGTEPFVDDEDESDYADPAARLVNSTTYEWNHPLGEVVTALVTAGLELRFLHEFDEISFQRFSFLERLPGPRRRYGFPTSVPSLPLEYSLLAVKPAAGAAR